MKAIYQISLLFILITMPVYAAVELTPPPLPTEQRLIQSYGKLPLSFEANEGQTDPSVAFLSRGSGYSLFLTSTEAVLSLRRNEINLESKKSEQMKQATLRMELIGANPKPRIKGVDPLSGTSNYFIGNAPEQWKRDIPNYAKVKYENVYPGINLVYYGNQSELEYDFVVQPGADPSAIGLEFKEIDRMKVDEQGDLILMIKGEEVRLHKPEIYQEDNGVKRAVQGRYISKGKNKIGFKVAAYNTKKALTIDPVLSYSTYLSGSRNAGFPDVGNAMAIDSTGNAYITGMTGSADFPVTPGPIQGNVRPGNLFIAKLNSTGTALIYATFLGSSSGQDLGFGIAVDRSGNAYVTGVTGSSDFPTTPGAFRSGGDNRNRSFVAKLNPSGNALVYSTYLTQCRATNIAVDGSGNAYITGAVGIGNFFTTPGAFQSTFAGGVSDAFITKLNPTGTAVIYSSYLGSSGSDEGAGIAVDALGNAYLTGNTDGTNFPSISSLQPFGGGTDIFVAKVNSTGSRLDYATYLGGSGEDLGKAIAIDSTGNAYITGSTKSPNFPTTPGAFQPISGQHIDFGKAFITKIGPTGNTVVYSSYLSGSFGDSGEAIAVDSAGVAYLTGITGSPDFPLVRPIKSSLAGGVCRFDCIDAFVTRVNPSGSALTFSSYLGGSEIDFGKAIAVDPAGSIYVMGTADGDFPTTPGALHSRGQIFVTKITDSPVLARISANVQSGGRPLAVHFEGIASSESGASITSYLWNFGDGTSASGPKVDHTYTEIAGYTVLLTVTDSNGRKGSAHATINVSDFSLSIRPNAETVVPGNGVTPIVLIGKEGRGRITVNLDCKSPSVPGLVCSIDPASVVTRDIESERDEGSTSTLKVTTQPSTPVGTYPIVVTGRSGGAVHQATYLLKVEPGDNFNRPNGSSLGPNWNEYLPNLELFNGQIRNTDPGSKAAVFTWPIGPNQDVSVYCKVTATGNSCAVMARWSDSKNYYHAGIDVGKLSLSLFKTVNGQTTLLGKVALPSGSTMLDTYYSLRLIAKGNALTATAVIPINDVEEDTATVNVTDPSLATGDYAGIRSFASAPYTTWFVTFGVTRSDGAPDRTVLFTDEFNRTTGLGSSWKVYAGSFTTDGNNAVSTGAVNFAGITPGLGTSNYSVESVLTIPSGALYSGIIARGNPSTGFYSDLYAAQISSSGTVNLYRRNAGNWTLLKSVAAGVTVGKPYMLRLTTTGSNPVSLQVFLNGRQLISYSDASASRILSGIPGIESYNGQVKYNRFTVTSP